MKRSLDASEAIQNLGVPTQLANDLVLYFQKIGDELRKLDLEKSSAGKFVETVVQILQALNSPSRSYQPTVRSVDEELTAFESRVIPSVNSESRLGIIRIARAIQCVRSKRSMVHKNLIDPNVFDLEFVHHSSRWIVTELVRLGSNSSVQDAAGIVKDIQMPVVPIVEVLLGRPLVLDNNVKSLDEVLIILYHAYSTNPAKPFMTRKEIGSALNRRSSPTVSRALGSLWATRLIDGSPEQGYQLTAIGIEAAREVIDKVLSRDSTRPL